MGESSQVAEGALGEAGDVVAVEGSEAEARVRSAPGTDRNSRRSPGVPGWPGVPSVSMAAPAAAAGDPPPNSLLHGQCVNISPPSPARKQGCCGEGVWEGESKLLIRTGPGQIQNADPFGCGTMGELLYFLGLHFCTRKMERESSLMEVLAFQR